MSLGHGAWQPKGVTDGRVKNRAECENGAMPPHVRDVASPVSLRGSYAHIAMALEQSRKNDITVGTSKALSTPHQVPLAHRRRKQRCRANGVPILKEVSPGVWVVQPVDANGVPLPLDAEGNLIDATQAIAVDLGRLNVGRSPLTVLSSQYEEALKNINAADSVTMDASGRLVLTTDGVVTSIDSPLANLALYVELLNKGTITGVTDISKFASNLQYLVDGTQTPADLISAASFLAAAADKAGTLTIDKVVDMNTILGITGTLTSATGATYIDYSTFTYDRASVYSTKTVDVLVKQADGTYKAETVNVFDAVFKDAAYSGTNVAAFSTAADDALQVIEFVHTFAIPVTE